MGSAADICRLYPLWELRHKAQRTISGILDEISVSWKAESHSNQMQHLSAPAEHLQAGLTSESGTAGLKSFQPLS